MTVVGTDRGVGSGLRKDTAIVTFCTLISRVSGFGRMLAVAAVLGSGLLGDVYQTANLIPNVLFELVAAGVLQAVLVPAFVSAWRHGGDEELSGAVRATSGATVAALAALSVAGMAASPLLSRLLIATEPSPDVVRDKFDLMVPMVLVFVPQLLCYGIATVTGAALNARGRFIAAALSPAANNVIVIVACLWFRHLRDGAVADLHLTREQFAVLAGGTTLGVVAMALVPTVVLRRDGVRWWPQWHPHHDAVRHMRASFGWATLSVVGTLLPTAAALALGNGAPGGVAVFVYAFAFFVLPHALVAVPIATTLAPRVADRWQVGDVDGLSRSVIGALRIMAPLLALGSAGLIALSWPVARAAAFGQTASQGIAPIAHSFIAFGFGLLGYGIAFVMMRVLFAMGDVRTAARLMLGAAAVGVVWMVVASAVAPSTDRAAALASGYGAAQAVAAILLTGRFIRLTGAMRTAEALKVVGEAVGVGTVATLVMWGIVGRFGTSRWASVDAVLVAGTAGVLVFGALLVAVRSLGRAGRAPAG